MDLGSSITSSVGIIAIVSGLIVLVKPKNGKHMTEDTKQEIQKLWQAKVGISHCEIVSKTIKEGMTEIKELQRETQQTIADIQKTLINWKMHD